VKKRIREEEEKAGMRGQVKVEEVKRVRVVRVSPWLFFFIFYP
jgi:hypothetical protein